MEQDDSKLRPVRFLLTSEKCKSQMQLPPNYVTPPVWTGEGDPPRAHVMELTIKLSNGFSLTLTPEEAGTTFLYSMGCAREEIVKLHKDHYAATEEEATAAAEAHVKSILDGTAFEKFERPAGEVVGPGVAFKDWTPYAKGTT